MHPPHNTAVLDRASRRPGGAVPVGTAVGVAAAAAVIALVVTALTTGVGGFEFRQDHRVTILSPGNGAEVPKGGELEVRWAVRGFTPLPDGSDIRADAPVDDRTGFFGVFVNTYVPPPGESLTQWAHKRNPSQCPADVCVGAGALSGLGALYTTGTSIAVPYDVNYDPDKTQATGITIVLLNARGERIGDSFWFLPTQDTSVQGDR